MEYCLWNFFFFFFFRLDAFKRLNCGPSYITRNILTCWLGNSECSLEPKSFLLTKPSTSSRESFLLITFEAVTHERRRPSGLRSASARTATQSAAAGAAPATLPAPSLPCRRGDTHTRTQQSSEVTVTGCTTHASVPCKQDPYKDGGFHNVFCHSSSFHCL